MSFIRIRQGLDKSNDNSSNMINGRGNDNSSNTANNKHKQ